MLQAKLAAFIAAVQADEVVPSINVAVGETVQLRDAVLGLADESLVPCC